MTPSHSALSRLNDRQLMDSLHAVVGRDRRLTAELLAHLGEVYVRGVCARQAEGSLYMYCVKVLRFSEGCAYKRIAAARVAREYPVVLDMVARGDLHISAINLLVSHLTAENHRELLAAAARKTKRELAEVLAERFPKPDVPARVRKLPEPRAEVRSPQLALTAPLPASTSVPLPQASDAQGALAATVGAACVSTCQAGSPSGSMLVLSSPAAAALGPASSASVPEPAYASARPQDRASVQPLSPGRYKLQVTLSRQGRDDLLRAQELMRHQQPDGDLAVVLERALSDLVVELERRKFGRLKGRARRGASASTRPTYDPGAGTRVTSEAGSSQAPEQAPETNDGGEQRCLPLPPAANASDQPHVELPPGANESADQVQVELAPGANASADPPHVELPPGANTRAAAHPGRARGPRLERRGGGRPGIEALSRYLPRALVRDVVRRDGMQCTYVGPDGRRCEARDFLEFHHIVPFARGGKATLENICLRCSIHHGIETVRDFGADAVMRHKKKRRSWAGTTDPSGATGGARLRFRADGRGPDSDP